MQKMSFKRRFELLISLTKHDISKKYKESILGAAWSILVPLIMLGIYTVIFSEIFNAHWAGQPVKGKADYAVILFVGLIVYQVFAEALTRAPTIVVSQPNLVKKVVFPLEILPGVVVLHCLYNAATASIGLLLVLAFSSFGLHWELVLLPVLLAPFIALVLGVVMLFASLGVFLRDIDQFCALLARILQYLSPVLYPSVVFPEAIGSVMRLSPIAVQIEQVRALTIFGTIPDWGDYLYSSTLSLAMLVIGWVWFAKTRKGFADVL